MQDTTEITINKYESNGQTVTLGSEFVGIFSGTNNTVMGDVLGSLQGKGNVIRGKVISYGDYDAITGDSNIIQGDVHGNIVGNNNNVCGCHYGRSEGHGNTATRVNPSESARIHGSFQAARVRGTSSTEDIFPPFPVDVEQTFYTYTNGPSDVFEAREFIDLTANAATSFVRLVPNVRNNRPPARSENTTRTEVHVDEEAFIEEDSSETEGLDFPSEPAIPQPSEPKIETSDSWERMTWEREGENLVMYWSQTKKIPKGSSKKQEKYIKQILEDKKQSKTRSKQNSRGVTKPRRTKTTKRKVASEKEDEEEEDKDQCVICMSAKRNTVNIPCGHVLQCEECSERLSKSKGRTQCSVCRQNVSNTFKIFL